MTVKEIFIKAKTLLEVSGWIQVKPLGKDGSLCFVAALFYDSAHGKDLEPYTQSLSLANKRAKEEGFIGIVDWNDHPGRTKEEVFLLLDKLISECE